MAPGDDGGGGAGVCRACGQGNRPAMLLSCDVAGCRLVWHMCAVITDTVITDAVITDAVITDTVVTG